MKKLLLSTFAMLAMAFSASADEAIVLFAGNENTFPNITNVASKPELEVWVTPTVINIPNFGTIEFTGTCEGYFNTNTGLSFLKMNPDATWIVTPKDGVTFTGFKSQSTTWSWGAGITANKGTCSYPAAAPADGTNPPCVWTGNETSAVTFSWTPAKKNQTALRIQYMTFEFSRVGSGVSSVTVDQAGNVMYFDMQGKKISEPTKGVPCIEKQGAKTTKVIVK